MKSAGELFNFGQQIVNDMFSDLADFTDDENKIADKIGSISVCSLRVRDVSSHSKTFHVLTRFENPIQKASYPYFTLTFEEKMGNTKFDVGIGFVVHNQNFVSYQPVGCYDCADEEYCSKQKDELLEEEFQFLPGDVLQAMNTFTSLWSPVLADFAFSFGTEYMYEEVPFILDQVFDSWTDIHEELTTNYIEGY